MIDDYIHLALAADAENDHEEAEYVARCARNDRAHRDAMAEAATKHYGETDPRRAFDDEEARTPAAEPFHAMTSRLALAILALVLAAPAAAQTVTQTADKLSVGTDATPTTSGAVVASTASR